MQALRISTTTIESFRLLLTADWMTPERFMADIVEFRQTPEMRAGKAFHQILETPDACRRSDGSYAHDGLVFPGSVVGPCLLTVDRSGPFEVKATKDYRIGGRDVTVVAKVDQLLGRRIREHKTKWSQFDIDSYAESCQWRFYCVVFDGARAVDYKVFRLSERANGYDLDGIEEFTVYPYPAMSADCAELLERFVSYIDANKLHAHFRPKPEGPPRTNLGAGSHQSGESVGVGVAVPVGSVA